MVKLHFRRLYQRHQMGVIDNAIVTFGKTPYEQRTYPVFPSFDNSPMKTYINRHSYVLVLDLWIVTAVFKWVGKDRKPPNAAA